MKKKKRIALVAHDQRKEDLLSWVKYNADVLSGHDLYATGTTGKIISEACSIDIHRSTADFIISSRLFDGEYEPTIKDYSKYISRSI